LIVFFVLSYSGAFASGFNGVSGLSGLSGVSGFYGVSGALI
jgi:hypothetical protein